MEKIDYDLLTIPALTETGNIVKDLVIDSLIAKGLVPNEEEDNLKDEFMVIITKRNWFRRRWKKFLEKNPEAKNEYTVQLVSTKVYPAK